MRRRVKAIPFVFVVLGLVTALGTHADAAPITGGLTFGGTIASTNFLTTNSIDVNSNTGVVTCAILGLGPCTGTYASLTGSINATYNDFTFNPVPPGGVVPLWSFTVGSVVYTFDLLTTTSITRSSSGIIIAGTGTAHVTGFDDTGADWSFSADRTGQFAFASTTNAVADPASTLLLFGTGLAAVAALRRRIGRG